MLEIRSAKLDDMEQLACLVGRFRVELRKLRGIDSTMNIETAKQEVVEYMDRDFPIYVAENCNEELIAYLVCRVEQDIVWVESFCVADERRRQGIGSLLYEQAELLAEKLNGGTVYTWVHPNNHKMISFLAKRGYDVLNLIELRKARTNEDPSGKVCVGKYEFNY